MLPNRNIQQPNLAVPGTLQGTDRGVRMLAGGNGVGMVPGLNRSIAMPRPGFQGITSSTMLNSGSMLSSSMVGMPSAVNMHSGASPSQGNSMFRPREALHMIRVSCLPIFKFSICRMSQFCYLSIQKRIYQFCEHQLADIKYKGNINNYNFFYC